VIVVLRAAIAIGAAWYLANLAALPLEQLAATVERIRP
jgi:hypothetical protein